MIVYLARDISGFVMYCVNGESGSSLLIESTDSMIYRCLVIVIKFQGGYPGVPPLYKTLPHAVMSVSDVSDEIMSVHSKNSIIVIISLKSILPQIFLLYVARVPLCCWLRMDCCKLSILVRLTSRLRDLRLKLCSKSTLEMRREGQREGGREE